jgi:serine/threonine protein kinase
MKLSKAVPNPTTDSSLNVFRIFMVVRAAVQGAKGLLTMHKEKVVFRDYKEQNIVLDLYGKYSTTKPIQDQVDLLKKSTAKIIDFNMARNRDDESLMTVMKGTFHYMAPEVKPEDDSVNVIYNESADTFSFGASTANQLSGLESEDTKSNPVLAKLGQICYSQTLDRNVIYFEDNFYDVYLPESLRSRFWPRLINFLVQRKPENRLKLSDAIPLLESLEKYLLEHYEKGYTTFHWTPPSDYRKFFEDRRFHAN